MQPLQQAYPTLLDALSDCRLPSEPWPSCSRSPQARIKELKDQGVASELVLIGNKGTTYYKRRETPVRRLPFDAVLRGV